MTPLVFDQVFQRIDVFIKDFDIIVELELGAPCPLPCHLINTGGTERMVILNFQHQLLSTKSYQSIYMFVHNFEEICDLLKKIYMFVQILINPATPSLHIQMK